MSLACAEDLKDAVLRAAAVLRNMTESDARTRRSPEKWSALEVIGHLIDSASNNHQRFVRAQFRPDLRFDGYDQAEWVRSQSYQTAPWPELLDLWETFNLHLARVMESVPEDLRTHPRPDHNLDAIAWEIVPKDEAVTLEYLMMDYVSHLKHHLRQIDERLATPPVLQRGRGHDRVTDS